MGVRIYVCMYIHFTLECNYWYVVHMHTSCDDPYPISLAFTSVMQVVLEQHLLLKGVGGLLVLGWN